MLIFDDLDFRDKTSGFDKAFIGQVSEVQDGLSAVASAPTCKPYSDSMGDTCAAELSYCLCSWLLGGKRDDVSLSIF